MTIVKLTLTMKKPENAYAMPARKAAIRPARRTRMNRYMQTAARPIWSHVKTP